MKKIQKITSFMVLMFSLVLQSFAIEAPNSFSVDAVDWNSIDLKWEAVDDALMYNVYFDKNSWTDTWYSVWEYTEDTSITIWDLEWWQTYYFSVVSLDAMWEESTFSNELVVDINYSNSLETTDNIQDDLIDSVSEINNFALKTIEVITYSKIELEFTNVLDDSEWTNREFKIRNKNDVLDEFEVVEAIIDEKNKNKLILTLNNDLVIWNEYEVITIAIFNNNWENIESWIDNSENFIVEEIIISEETELNAASEEEWPNWINIESNEINNTTLALAENSDSLPKTGPEHILMIILSIILGTLVFLFKYKKSNSKNS